MSSVGVSSHGPVVHVRRGRSLGWWGMMGMIATESALFALLLFVYFYFQAGEGPWPPDGLPLPELTGSAIRSLILLGSSIPIVLAERALEHRDDRAKCVVWSFVALAMAGVFLVGHIQEQFKMFEELAPMATAYGSTMVTILNFHISHLIVGMLILAFVVVQVLRGRITRERYIQFEIGALYWHFVDVIWIFVYASLFLSPHVLRN